MSAEAHRPAPPGNRLYAIVDSGRFGVDAAAVGDAVRALLDCGVEWIQLRAKNLSDRDTWTLAEAAALALDGGRPGDAAAERPLLWINDHPAIGAALRAEGVGVGLHLGQEDLPLRVARLLLPAACPVGLSTHDGDQAAAAHAEAAVDVVAIGPVFGTRTKERPDPVVGLAGVARARAAGSKPLVGIGGIDAERAPRVIEAGADAIAVVSALDPRQLAASCTRLLRALA